ncbi:MULTISPECIES: tautomerase family protein [unclassified Moritella]|uniref:tautomerase family protein n=1 Tax=unclassified Moritella TaxID=2637987 RepID=UPI001BA54887|nr:MULTISPECIES: tautomerase family protein [unclassified Moritella]QUM86707.1 tautomerase family protein [Moritella sp. 28]QUM90934.1 tautomerase family protein [Moritella sp. 36]
MPIINVTTWKSDDKEMKKKLLQELTKTTHEVTGAPLDKITVYIQEIERSEWAEAGVTGDDTNFPIESRRKTYT